MRNAHYIHKLVAAESIDGAWRVEALLTPGGISLRKCVINIVQKFKGKGMFFREKRGPVGTVFRGPFKPKMAKKGYLLSTKPQNIELHISRSCENTLTPWTINNQGGNSHL